MQSPISSCLLSHPPLCVCVYQGFYSMGLNYLNGFADYKIDEILWLHESISYVSLSLTARFSMKVW
jgi:hypothetical protein